MGESYQVAYTAIPAVGSTFTRTVTNPLGKISDYTFLNDAVSGLVLTGVSDRVSPHSPASSEAWTYGSDGFAATHTDKNGVTETYESSGFPRDPRGMPMQTIEASGMTPSRTTNFAWDTAWHEPDTVTVPALSQTAYAYNSFGAVTSKTLTDQTSYTTPYPTNGRLRTWIYDWNVSNQLTAVHGPRWVAGGTVDTTSFGYNASGYLASLADALGHTTSVTAWDWRGAPLTVADPNGVQTTFTWDIHGRLLTATVNPGAAQSLFQFAYDAVGDLAQVTLPMGAILTYQWDQGRRLATVTNTRNETRTFTYDSKDDPLTLTTKDASGATTQTGSAAYDEWGRIIQSIGAASQAWSLAWDNLDNLTSITDPAVGAAPPAVRSNLYDALNRVVKRTDPESHFVQYGYDLADNLNQLIDARSIQTNRVVDGFGEAIQETGQDRGTLTYWYDPSGNLTKQIDGRSVETDLVYDNANRLVSRCWPSEATCTGTIGGGVGQEAYAYDQTAGGNFGVGRLTGVTDESGDTILTYDAQGRVTADARVISGGSLMTPFTTRFAYDANGKVSQITYPSGDGVGYARATDGLVTGVTFTPSSGTDKTIASAVAYAPFGDLASLAYGNGLNLTRTYDQDYRLTGVAAAPSSGPAALNLSFGWQADGRIAGVGGTSGASSMAASYGYTPSGRVQAGNGPWGNLTYGWDASGNLTQNGMVTTKVSASSNQLTQTKLGGAVQRKLSYDGGGNLTGDNTLGGTNFGYVYNAAARLTAAQKAVSPPTPFGAYAYDFAGRRVWRQTFGGGAGQTAYVHDEAGHVLAEHDAATGAANLEYIWLDERLIGMATFSGGILTTRFVATGQIDEPLLVTQNNQAVYWSGYLDPLGNAATFGSTLSRMNLRYPGQWFQAEASVSGLHQNGWRDYDPSLGRYVETDPLGINAGADVYAYVDGDPVNLTDPAGLTGQKLCPEAQRAKTICIIDCSDHALPTRDYGAAFFKCLEACMRGFGFYPNGDPLPGLEDSNSERNNWHPRRPSQNLWPWSSPTVIPLLPWGLPVPIP